VRSTLAEAEELDHESAVVPTSFACFEKYVEVGAESVLSDTVDDLFFLGELNVDNLRMRWRQSDNWAIED